MRFGIYTEMQTPLEKPHAELTWEIMRQIEHADALGFETYSVIEYHFYQQFGISANPLTLFTAAAQRTQRMRFRTLCHTLPLHNPLLLAGEIAEADILTQGRLECGIGRGHVWLYEPAGVAMEESQPRFDEAMEILRCAWSQERFSFDGQFYTVQDVAVVPKPVQQPHPPLYVVGTSDHSFRMAGERGFRVATGGPVPWPVAAHGIETYKHACAAHGHTPYVTFIRPVYFGDDQQHIRHEVEGFFRNYLTFNASAMDAVVSEDKKAAWRAKGFGFYASGVVEQFRTMTYDQVLDAGLAFVGTPAEVIAHIRAVDQQIGGLQEFVIMSQLGGMEHWRAIRTQELFATQVIPAFAPSVSG
jgi:alkanesulfonate monooxygenase SsuD/methylene tetrahydromethanopterin reductase-like flavin-dependent oxidoreductase (luciferase family)